METNKQKKIKAKETWSIQNCKEDLIGFIQTQTY